jgi:hypothetical protein
MEADMVTIKKFSWVGMVVRFLVDWYWYLPHIIRKAIPISAGWDANYLSYRNNSGKNRKNFALKLVYLSKSRYVPYSTILWQLGMFAYDKSYPLSGDGYQCEEDSAD